MVDETSQKGDKGVAQDGGIRDASIGFGNAEAPAPRAPLQPSFELLVLAPFGITAASTVRIDLSTDFNEAMAAAAPRFDFNAGGGDTPNWIALTPSSLRDLSAARLASHLPAPAPKATTTQTAVTKPEGEEPNLEALLSLVDIEASESKRAGSLLDEYVDNIRRDSSNAAPAAPPPSTPDTSQGLTTLLADPAFSAFEAAWRGARLLAGRADVRAGVRLTLANLPEDFDGLDSALFAQADLVLVDLAFADKALDITRLEALAALGENERAPVVTNIEADLLADAPAQNDPGQSFLTMRTPNWHSLRDREETAWLALCWNDVALLGAESRAGQPLWGGAAWLLSVAAIESQKRHGWPVDLARWIEGLEVVEHSEAGRNRATPVRYDLSRDQLADLGNAGISAAAAAPDRDRAIFPRAVTLKRERRITGDSGGARSRRQAEFGHSLALARIIGALEAVLPRWRALSPEAAVAEAERFADALIGETGPNAGYAVELRQDDGRQCLELSLKGGDTLLAGDNFSFDLPLS